MLKKYSFNNNKSIIYKLQSLKKLIIIYFLYLDLDLFCFL